MKKNNLSIDDFFRDVLNSHTIIPSEAAKEAFLKEAATVVNNRKSGKRWFLILLSGIIVTIGGLGIYFATKPTLENTISSKKVAHSSFTKTAISSPSYKTSNNLSPNSAKDHELTKIKSKPTSRIITPSVPTNHQQKTTITLNSQVNHQKSEISQPSISPVIQEEKQNSDSPEIDEPKQLVKPEESTNPTSAGEITPEFTDIQHQSKPSIIDSAKLQESSLTPKKTKPEKTNKNWNISAGVYYSPEWMFNIIEDNKFVNSFGAEGTFRFANYSIRTGIGLSITKGTNELAISYNDYLGNYHKLDSMSFKWNTQHNKLVPTYYLSDKNVYDSLMKLDNARIVKRYTYLQVPLILGYDFWRNEKFAIGLRAGPILSILLETKQLSGEYDSGKNKIIAINQISPERIHTNWQVMGGINACLNFSRRFGIEVEPEVRYYFNSVYEKSDYTKKPWSVGFRVAFHISY